MKIFKSYLLKSVLKLSVSLILLFLIFRFISPYELYKELQNSNIFYLILSSILFMVFLMPIKALRWKGIINAFNRELSFNSALKYTYISLAFGGVTPAKVGEFIKAKYLATDTGMGNIESISTVILDKIFDLATVILFSLVGLSFIKIPGMSFNFFALALILYAVLLLIIFVYFKNVLKIIHKILPGKYKHSFTQLAINRNFCINSMVLSIVVWLIYSLQAYLVIKSLGISPQPFYWMVSITSLMAFSSIVPISINGIGIREIISISFLSLAGIVAKKSTAFSLLYTLVTFGIAAIIGAIMYIKEKNILRR